jgi:ParB/RepB/Spo0J family partition protein
MGKGKLLFIELKQIQLVKGQNPRQVDLKSQAFLGLVESVTALGVIVPVHVRTPSGLAGPYELLAGERRYWAATQAALKTIPAIDHGQISDEEAFEITFAENFAREDLTTLEQGRAVGLLLERYKGDYAAVASKLGKPESWVRMRHAIETNLDKEWKAMVSPGGRLERWTAAHLELIARFPASVQLTILKDVSYRSDLSVKELAQKVADKLRLIRKACFDTAECIKCSKRSDAQPELWTDAAATKVGTSDRCLDAQCWARKDLAARKQELQELRDKYPGMVSVCTSLISGARRTERHRPTANTWSRAL